MLLRLRRTIAPSPSSCCGSSHRERDEVSEAPSLLTLKTLFRVIDVNLIRSINHRCVKLWDLNVTHQIMCLPHTGLPPLPQQQGQSRPGRFFFFLRTSAPKLISHTRAHGTCTRPTPDKRQTEPRERTRRLALSPVSRR